MQSLGASTGSFPSSARCELWWKESNPHPLGNNQARYRYATPQESVRMAGFEPALSSTPSWRIAKLSHILIPERQVGIEPTLPRLSDSRICTKLAAPAA
jgi:hypothetical protein